MQTKHTFTILTAAFALLTGCATHNRGPAYGHESVFRQQIAESVPVQKWGYKVQNIRFSEDYRKALVVFETKRGKPNEVVLNDDGFRRYVGRIVDFDTGILMGASNRVEPAAPRSDYIKVTFPEK